eukprot:NODE_4549_length_315_cov_28.654135_g4467_i0.p3 GENE.NODE_4549_length_315_cov_28.654135_g4467_i0~~NODE_4549_length_315_cov_28.654135_g4467_i0.p3  ORF type:complete len:56 (-),score=6.91 NODE_4549_length_315_cov_28.654135_g4467_i0:88-255(-)
MWAFFYHTLDGFAYPAGASCFHKKMVNFEPTRCLLLSCMQQSMWHGVPYSGLMHF